MSKLHFISEERLEHLVEAERSDAFKDGLRKGRESLAKELLTGCYLRYGPKGVYFLPQEIADKIAQGRPLPKRWTPEPPPNEFTCIHGHTFEPGDTGDCYEHIYGKKKVKK